MSVSDKQIAHLEKLLKSQYDGINPLKKMQNSEPEDVVKFFEGMSEEDRRELAPQVKSWRKTAMDWESGFDLHRVWLALHATATQSELNKIGNWFVGGTACQIVADRQIPWLQDWSEQALGHVGAGYSIGDLVTGLNDLEQRGLISTPQHDSYAIGIAYSYMSLWGDDSDGAALVSELKKDLPKWGENIWRQFEVEGGGEISLANFDKYMAPKLRSNWSQTLVTLANDGALDRNRMLDASLDALNRGFKQFCANWFSQLHEDLNPTPEERAARQNRYCSLLASPIGPTVSMAIAALVKVQKSGQLDQELLLGQVEPALYAKAAKTAKGALSLLANIADEKSDARSAVLVAVAAALEHPKTDVQQAGLKLLEKHAAAVDSDARAAIGLRKSVISPTLRARLEALTDNGDEIPAEPSSSSNADLAALNERAAAVPLELRRLAGVDIALDALTDAAADVPRTMFTGMDVPRLDPSGLITPIETFAELIDEALVAVEHSHEFERIERVLAGAVRFAAARPENAAELLTPLTKSLNRFKLESGIEIELATPRGTLQTVLGAFSNIKTGQYLVDETDPCAVAVLRAQEIARAITEGQVRQQFSAPTHRGFWIDPLALVERTRSAAETATEALGHADQCLALLRLAPDRREQALEQAQGLDGEWASALRYALGGTEKIGKTLSLWVAAARARDPFAEDENIAGLSKQKRPGQQLAPALRYFIKWDYERFDNPSCNFMISNGMAGDKGQDFGRECWIPFLGEKDPKQQADPAKIVPTVGLSDPSGLRMLDIYQGWGTTQVSTSWIQCLWPQHPEPLFTLAVKAGCMLDGVVGFEPATEPLADGLIVVHDPDVPLGPMGVMMLCRGLNTLDKPAAQATVDALIAVIEDGRLDGATWGNAIHEILMGGIVVAKRWPDHLRDVARASPLHAQTVRVALQHAVHPGTAERPLKNMHAWLEVLHELCVEADVAIEDAEVREGLAAHFSSGQAKKLAKILLDLKLADGQNHRMAAAAYALERRIERAERWQSWMA